MAGYTLGGGAGWLARTYGFAADSLLRAEVVTADGAVLTASPEENPDLFWALRGGGGNFGVVTELEFRLYPVDRVYGGMEFFAIDRAAETIARYRDWAENQPDEMNSAVVLMRMPPAPQVPEHVRGRRVLVLGACYVGEPDDGERLLAPLRAIAGQPVMGGLTSMSFGELQAVTGPPPPPQAAHDHLDLFRELPDRVIDTIAEAAGGRSDSPVSRVEIRHWGGAMARPPAGAGPMGHRDTPFSIYVQAAVANPDGPESDRARTYLAGLAGVTAPHATGGSFLNFLHDPARTETAYTPGDYRRLVAVKTAYDPDNVFRLGHNIPPSVA